MAAWRTQADLMQQAQAGHRARTAQDQAAALSAMRDQVGDVLIKLASLGSPQRIAEAFAAYQRDAAERSVLTLDALRKRGDTFFTHNAAGAPPVLIYGYDVVMDGANLPQPTNYILLRIKPPEGVKVHDWKRPYVIIDPRAGHGPGIGGFKLDSQVGVALADGHPVYFVAFRPMPVPSQTIADVTRTEAAFLRKIHEWHGDAPKPVMVGNCQGGWATAILAATHVDLPGPIVLNGAPMAYWSGRLGQDPMRYTGGVAGGILPALLLADLGGGFFDGAHLVQNFETLNPGRTWFRKYYDLFAHIDSGETRFLEFEKWWGGFFMMTGAEIRWIVENLFIGNRLGKNEARLETGRPIDLKAIRAPIIVFASHGDNITPPQQALNWIIDTYSDAKEIEIRGQRILYMIHEEVGHLGIFVSSSVAKREHMEMASTLKTIEALPPGLYEMKIEDFAGEGKDKTFTVSFHKRGFEDIERLDDSRNEEAAFAAVARQSGLMAELYDTTLAPALKAMIPPEAGEQMRALHPMRVQRSIFATANPAMAAVGPAAEEVRDDRHAAMPDNPFLLAERLWADMVETSWNMIRDARALATEMTFLALYAHPLAVWFGAPQARSRRLRTDEELQALPEVRAALDRIKQGGFTEAVIRLLVLLADTRGDVRRDRLERSAKVLTTQAPFAKMDPDLRARLIHEQTLIAHFAAEEGLAAVPAMIKTKKDRKAAMEAIDYIVGSREDMEPETFERLAKMRELLKLPPLLEVKEAAA